MICRSWLGPEVQVVSQVGLQAEIGSSDSDDVPQQRRPTASARRQQEAAPIDEDAPETSEDVLAPSAEAVDGGEGSTVDDAQGFPGGPRDPSVLTSFADHVSLSIWNEEVF